MIISFISWARYQRRTARIAEQLGATAHFIRCGRGGRPLTAPKRYYQQARKTWAALRQDRPDVILVQNPPLPLVLLADVYCRLRGARYIIDSHTGAFVSSPWRQFLWLHRLLSRRALTTLVHNWAQGDVVKTWGCPWMELIGCPLSLPPPEPVSLEGAFRVLVASSFDADEPVRDVIAAARLTPRVHYYVTGDPSRLDPRVLGDLPPNCHFTGYLSYEDYMRHMQSVDAVMALTTRDGTLLQAAWEGIALGRPLILSDWPVLRSYFYAGTVHTANRAASIAQAVQIAEADLPNLRQGIADLQEELEATWRKQFADLQRQISAAAKSTAADRPWKRAPGTG